MVENYVTRELCAEHREKINSANAEQNCVIAKLDTEVEVVKKLMYSILAVLVSGFAGTIFAVLSVGM